MSSTSLMGLSPNTKTIRAVELDVYRNSWGGAAKIWTDLFHKYIVKEHEYESWLTNSGSKKLWALADDKHLPLHQRAVLYFTFDHCYVAKKNYERLANDLEKFCQDFETEDGHLPAWAKFFRSKPKAKAIGLYGTSCGDCYWYGEDDKGTIDWSQTYELYSALDTEEAKT